MGNGVEANTVQKFWLEIGKRRQYQEEDLMAKMVNLKSN
jgi:hypothetical protein